MSSEKPNFLSQPVVKNIFMYRNGDPYYDARRIVINEKRVCNFETLLREVTGGIQAPFGAVRNIYTPRGGHKVDSLQSLQSGEQYVAAGKERFKKLDYLQIGSRRKRMMQTLPMQARPVPQNRIIVSARFLKPIKEPCTIFVVANGDTLNPAIRLLIHQRMLGQFERILEMISEKMGLRVLGGVRSLYTYEGQQVTEGNLLESGQLYVAVGREKFKRLPYSDLLFTRPRGTRRVKGMKAYSLPPLYRYSKQNENSKTMVRCIDSGDGDSKASPPNHNGSSKENLSSIVREISQARLLSFRKRKSGQSFILGTSDNDDPVSKADDGNTDIKSPQEEKAQEIPDANADLKATEEKDEEADQKEEPTSKNTTEEDATASKVDNEEDQKKNGEKEGREKKEADEQNDEKLEEAAPDEKKVEEVKEDVKEEVTEESKKEVKSEMQGTNSANSDKTQDNKEKGDGSHLSSEAEMEPDKDKDEDKQDEDSGNKEKSSNGHINDVDTAEEQKETGNSSSDKTQSDNDTTENENSGSSNSNSNQEEDLRKITEEASKESGVENEVNGEVKGDDDQVESKGETEKKNSDSFKDAIANGEKRNAAAEESQDKSRKED